MTVATLAALGITEVVPYALPLTRRFRGITVREGVLLRGPSGWGEWAPFPEYEDEVAARWLCGALEQATSQWPAPVRDTIAVNAIVPALEPAAAAQFALEAYEQSGCTTIKVKVAEPGTTSAQDRARLTAVASALPDHVLFRVDANGAWSVDEAEEALLSLGEVPLEYVEQPCATLPECAALRVRLRACGLEVRIAVDEGVRLAAAPDSADTVAQLRAAADIVIVKSSPLGGVARALRVAKAIGLPTVVSGALDTAVGLSAGLALAAALPDQPFAAGLGTGRLLQYDVTAEPVVPRDGALDVCRHSPEPDALAAASGRMPADRGRWWLARLDRAATVVASDPAGWRM